MDSLEERIERLEFYQTLLLDLLGEEQVPVYRLFMKSKLSKKEAVELLSLCEELNNKYQKQKAEGLLVFTPLLTQFVGMLHPKLHPMETVEAFLKQRMFQSVMEELKRMMKEINE